MIKNFLIKQVEFLELFTSIITNYSWNATCLFMICKPLYDMDDSLTDNLSPNIVKNI